MPSYHPNWCNHCDKELTFRNIFLLNKSKIRKLSCLDIIFLQAIREKQCQSFIVARGQMNANEDRLDTQQRNLMQMLGNSSENISEPK